jgi:vitamin B12 transporter
VGSVLDRVSYTLSGRVDNNSDYDHFGTYRLGANVVVLPNVRLRGSLASAFNAPAFSQLRPTLFTTGSPDLRPEKSHAAEVGVSVGPNTGFFSLTGNYFQQRFSDLIQYVPGSAPDFRGSYANLTGATSNGYEAEVAATPTSTISVSASYTVITPRVREIPAGYQGSDQVGDELIRRASHSGRTTFSYRRHAASIGAAVSYVGKRADMDFGQFPSPRVSLPAYSKVDLSGEAPLTRLGAGHLLLSARIENLFDREYEEVLHFPAPGRTILIGARASSVF